MLETRIKEILLVSVWEQCSDCRVNPPTRIRANFGTGNSHRVKFRCSFNDRLEEKGTAVGTETRAELVESNCTFVSDRVNRSMTKRVVSDRFRGYKVETDGSSINHRCNFFFLFFSFSFSFFVFFLLHDLSIVANIIPSSHREFMPFGISCRYPVRVSKFPLRQTLRALRGTLLIFENCLLKELVSRSKLRMGRETRRNSISNASSNGEMRKNLGVKFGLRGDRIALSDRQIEAR